MDGRPGLVADGGRGEQDDLFELDQLIGAYLHQNMEMEVATVPQAIARYARLNDEPTKRGLVEAMERFLHRFGNDLHGEFARRYRYDVMPEDLGLTVPEFFDMVRTLLADPDEYRRFEATQAPGGAGPALRA
ncbi:contact-dependent growth inhibition system immunity protein [Aureimonas sp. ME7]|uniref:contact-dependent growth inhibition system immunity protein n=1 Tax=Aureimonas sp. ME7 TaxID=2744252 RepID=UPI0015F60D0C|nr:contact-dependent growth inhibition system immunity protein [Aureimonas sp. ME7]